MNSKSALSSMFLIVFLLFAREADSKKAGQAGIIFTARIENRQSNKMIIATELINNSDSTLNYLTMSCDSLVVYRIEGGNLKIAPIICEYNVPVNARLLPHKSLKQKLTLLYNRQRNVNDTLLKIGFNLFGNEHEVLFDKHAARVIWSENLLK